MGSVEASNSAGRDWAVPTARILSAATGGTRVSDSMLRLSVLSSEIKEMVGCRAGIRLGDQVAVSASLRGWFLPGFETGGNERSAADR